VLTNEFEVETSITAFQLTILTWTARHSRRQDTAEGKTQQKARYNRRQDTAEGKTQQKARHSRRQDTAEGKKSSSVNTSE